MVKNAHTGDLLAAEEISCVADAVAADSYNICHRFRIEKFDLGLTILATGNIGNILHIRLVVYNFSS